MSKIAIEVTDSPRMGGKMAYRDLAQLAPDLIDARIVGASNVAGGVLPITTAVRDALINAGAYNLFYTDTLPNLAAWYKPGVGVTGTLTASNWADQSGNGRDLAQATGANQPIYLPYSGTPYGWVPAVIGNAFSCPKPATALTGDICIKVRVAADDVTVIDRTYCGKRRAANDFQFTSGSSAKLPKFFWWQGAALKTAASTVQHSFSNGQAFWVAVTLDVDDGAGNCVAKFYTSPDGDTPSWTLLDTVTQAFTTSIDNGAGFIASFTACRSPTPQT